MNIEMKENKSKFSATSFTTERDHPKIRRSETFSADVVPLSLCERFTKWRKEYESRPGGARRIRAHVLTNHFYLNPKVETGYQEWSTREQLPSSRMLSFVLVFCLCLYQGYSSLKPRESGIWYAFAVRVSATAFFALIVLLLFCVRFAQKYWKHFLSMGIIVLLGVECFYRSAKLNVEGRALLADTHMILNSSDWFISPGTQDLMQSKSFDDAFEKLMESPPYNASASDTFAISLTLLNDEMMLLQSRTWPMWTVIISVILRIDVFLTFPAMITVMACYLSLGSYYHINGFQDGIRGDIQSMALLSAQLVLLLFLASYNDRFLRTTYIQIEDSERENNKLRQRLSQLGHPVRNPTEDSEVIITTPMESVLHQLNKIKQILDNDDLGPSLGPVLESVIDTLAITQASSSTKSVRTWKRGLTGVDAETTSWLLNQAGHGDRCVFVADFYFPSFLLCFFFLLLFVIEHISLFSDAAILIVVFSFFLFSFFFFLFSFFFFLFT